MASPLIIRALELGPSAFFHVIDDIRPEKFQDRLGEDRFTLSEMVAHLADFEDVMLERLRLAHEKPGSPIEGFDPGQRAIDKHYATRDLHHELEVFRNRRNDTVDFLRNVTSEEEARTVVHPHFGEISITDLTSFLMAHDLYHLEQASHYLR